MFVVRIDQPQTAMLREIGRSDTLKEAMKLAACGETRIPDLWRKSKILYQPNKSMKHEYYYECRCTYHTIWEEE